VCLYRQDLYFRLAVVPVHVPPLRERTEDVIPLAEHILRSVGGESLSLSPQAFAQLRSHEWPGNVRELRNVLERATVLAKADGENVIHDVGLSPPPPVGSPADLFVFSEDVTYREARARVEAEFERRFVAWILAQSGGNVAGAARKAHMDRKYLADLVRKHGL
jgi:transcriptional regulator with GAF, ATPase, and Fis domain